MVSYSNLCASYYNDVHDNVSSSNLFPVRKYNELFPKESKPKKESAKKEKAPKKEQPKKKEPEPEEEEEEPPAKKFVDPYAGMPQR